MAKNFGSNNIHNRTKRCCLLVIAVLLTVTFGTHSSKLAQAQEPECPPGFDWQRMSGVGCVQSDCPSIPNAKYSYTSACICLDGFKGCYEPVDSTGVACGPNCPYSKLVACVPPDAPCPGEDLPPAPNLTEPSPNIPADTPLDAGSPPVPPTSQIPSEIDLFSDLEEFLAGEGISSPTPGQIAAGGAALSTLLATWVLINLLSGIPPKTSLQTIADWRSGKPPNVPAQQTDRIPAEPQTDEKPPVRPEKPPLQPAGTRPPVSEPVSPPAPIADTEPQPPAPIKRPPLGETLEERTIRTVQDAQDLDDAIKNTRQQFESFIDKIPESVRNSDEWQTRVKPNIDRIKNLLQQGELDKGRTWLDRLEQLIKVRDDIDHDLSYLPGDKREAVVWTERTLRTLGHFASDAYQNLVIEPAKNAGGALLPSEYAQAWNKHMDELGNAISDVAQQVGELPRTGTRLMTHGNLQDQASEMLQSTSPEMRQQGQDIRDLYGPRDVPVEYPDFWGKGTRKVTELWNASLGRLFK